CATHKSVKDMIARGDFREDLYYRLNGMVVRLPALRERTDFALVVSKILQSLCEDGHNIGLSPEVMDLFKRYHWPGNFRQLYYLVRTAVVMVGCSGWIEVSHLPDDFLEELQLTPPSYPMPMPSGAQYLPPLVTLPTTPAEMKAAGQTEGLSLQDVTMTAMAQMLRLHKGNVSAAARALGVSRNTIYRKKDLLPPDVLR
ncbi:MAG: helix-turn-helix domain-containing protein, partial [Giesbergeria sp.]|nr:helix-turn-helix domain-containing protein [Giesbergeria sp.]